MTNCFQTSRLQWGLACVMAGLASACGGAAAQDVAYSTRAVQIVVPYSTGATADILARLLGPNGGPPDRFAGLLKSELARWSRVVAAAKIKLD